MQEMDTYIIKCNFKAKNGMNKIKLTKNKNELNVKTEMEKKK